MKKIIKPEQWVKLSKVLENGQEEHLYLTSDDWIKEGDKVILNNKIYTFDKISGSGADALFKEKGVGFHSNQSGDSAINWLIKNCKKVIATTDKSLTPVGKDMTSQAHLDAIFKLPEIPENMVKYYVEKQGKVGDVEVEFKGIAHPTEKGALIVVKLTGDNEIIVSLPEVYCKHVKREGGSCSLNNNCTYPNCEEPCVHPFARLHWVGTTVFCNQCKTNVGKPS